MRKLALTAVAILVLSSLGVAGSKERTFSGEIMDSQCAKMGSHDTMFKKEGTQDPKQCTVACVGMGGKYVLFSAADKAVYQLDDQSKPEQFAGEKVNVKGTLDKKTKTIRVADITKAS